MCSRNCEYQFSLRDLFGPFIGLYIDCRTITNIYTALPTFEILNSCSFFPGGKVFLGFSNMFSQFLKN